MSNASRLPLATELYLGQWSNPNAEAPVLATPIDADDTTIVVSTPLKDSTSTIVTGGFLMGIKRATGFSEIIWVPAGAVSADGLTLTGCVRGIKPDGYDYTVGSASFATAHNADEPVFCVIPAILPELLRKVLQGVIASGAANFILGVDAAGTVTISRSTGTGTYVGFLRWYVTSGKVQYSNDGTTWVNIEDTAASVIFKISATDTTAGYGMDKIIAGSGVTITQTGTGGNETLVVASSLPAQISTHATYTPAYLTGGASAESNPAIWDSVTDGAFQITINGTVRSITGLDFSAITDMDGVAAVIQAGIRALTGSTETCVWSTDHFVITSADTTATSAMTVLTAGASGTDISGVGTVYMDSETGRGTVTVKQLDQTLDAGKVPIMEASGNLDAVFCGNAQIMVAGETIDGTSTPQAVFVSDGSDSKTAGRIYKADANDLTTMRVRFFGFVKTSVVAGDTVVVYTSGVVTGFTGLTPGVDYFLSTTAGAISTTAYNSAVCVGNAKSATELFIYTGKRSIMATFSFSVASTTTDYALTIGFRAASVIATFEDGDFGGAGKPSFSEGMWNGGDDQCRYYAYTGGAGTTPATGTNANLGYLYYNNSGGPTTYTATFTVLSLTNNTITIRCVASGVTAAGQAILHITN